MYLSAPDGIQVPTFKIYAEAFMDTYSAMNHKESTQESYLGVLKNHVYPFIGDKPLNEITKQDIKEILITKRQDGLSANTVKLIKAYMASIFECAVGDDELIDSNPVKSLGKRVQEILKKKSDTEDIKPLTRGELQTLLTTVDKHFKDHYPLILTLARTGMRIGEALAIKWDDIDFNERFIEVKRQYSKGRLFTPKNHKSRRVDMSKQLCDVLKRHRINCKKKGFELGLGDAPEYVFTNTMGKLIDLHGWRRRVFKKVLEKAKMRHIRIHDLRHTYATIRISEGHDIIVDVSNQLGHHTEAFTLRVYNHWMPGKRKSEIDALDDPEYSHPSAPYMHPDANQEEKS